MVFESEMNGSGKRGKFYLTAEGTVPAICGAALPLPKRKKHC